jgi:hypothetical protein
MRWYWVVTNDNAVADPLVTDEGDLHGFEDWMLVDCREITNWPVNAWVGTSTPANDGEPDDSLQNHFDLLIFSHRFRTALADAGIGEIQFLPIDVVRPGGGRVEGYRVANLLSCVTALDLERSKFTRYPNDYFLPERRGQLELLRGVTLSATALQGHDIVRLKEYRSKVFVSERFAAVVRFGRFTGLSFSEVKLS